MEVMKDIIIPLVTATFIIGIGGYLGFIVFRAFYKVYTREIKFFIKFSILRKPYDQDMVDLCYYFIDEQMDINKAKVFLLINGSNDKDEIIYIYSKILKSLKGGV